MKKKIAVLSLAAIMAALPLMACQRTPTSSSSEEPTPASSEIPTPASSEVPTPTPSSSGDAIEHRTDFTKTIDSSAVTRTYDERYDKIIEDFSGNNINGTTTGEANDGYLRAVIDSDLESYPGDAGAALYKLASGNFESMNLGSSGIGFKMRVKEGSLKLSDLVLELRGSDSFETYPIALDEALNGDAEANPELTGEYQDIVINPSNTIEDENTYYKDATTGADTTTKVLDLIIGFHLRAKTGIDVSAILEIDEVFTYVGPTRTVIDDFNRDALNSVADSVSGAWWGGNDSGCSILVRKGLSIGGAKAYTTPTLTSEEATYTHAVFSLLGDTAGASLKLAYSDGTDATVAYADLTTLDGAKAVGAVNGAYAPYAYDISAIAGEKTISTVTLTGGTGELYISEVFLTSFEEPDLDKTYPSLKTEDAVIIDNFNREINGLGGDYEASHALEANVAAGIEYTLSYASNGGDLKLDGTDAVIPATADYYQLKTETSRDASNKRYLVFAIKGDEGYSLDGFRFATGDSSVIYLNQCYAKEGVKTYNDEDVDNPYEDVNGYTWYVIDLEYHDIESSSMVDIYYTGDKAIKIGYVFVADEANDLYSKRSAAMTSGTLDLTDYVYGGGFQNVHSRYVSFQAQGDGTTDLSTFRLGYGSDVKWANGGLIIRDADGKKVDYTAQIPTELTEYVIDLEENGFTLQDAEIVFHFGGGSGTIVLGTANVYEKMYIENIGFEDTTVTWDNAYKYGFGIVTNHDTDRIYFKAAGDGTAKFDTFRVEQSGVATLYPSHQGAEHLYLRTASDDAEVDADAAIPTAGETYYIDLAENGYSASGTFHFHFGDAGSIGTITFSAVTFGHETRPYAISSSGFSETLPTLSSED